MMRLHPQNAGEKLGFDVIREATVKRARSNMGRERLEKLTPSSNGEAVKHRLEETDELIRLLRNDEALPLHNMHDVSSHLEKARADESMLPPEVFRDIKELLSAIRTVRDFARHRSQDYPALYSITEELVTLKELENQIDQVVDEHGEILSNASAELARIHKDLNRKRDSLRKTVNNALNRARKNGIASDEGPTFRNGRMVIPIKSEYKRKLQGFLQDVSGSGQTVYIEPVEALEINNSIRQLESAEQREIERILRNLTDQVRKHHSEISDNLKILGHLDELAAKAQLSVDLDGHIPTLSEERNLKLEQAYNPLLKLKNLQRPREKRENIIPLDLELDPDERCLMITGPNAGGKSVAMKTLGLCCMMMQSGYAIPASPKTILPVTSGIFVDMGDDQSIENDLSTFSSRLEWMRDTLNRCDDHSLVLIDEAGAGTDPDEAGALFQSLIESLTDRGSRVIVTTHHGSLKVFAHDHAKAVNGSMEFNQGTLSPTYHFQKGVPGSSYAFEIARRMELDQEVLDRSSELVGENKSDLESLINDLKSKTQEVEELRKKYQQLKQKMESERKEYEQEKEKLRREKDKLREKALREANKIVEKANKRIEEAVEQISEQGSKDRDKIKEARKKVEQFRERVTEELDEVEKRKRKQEKEDHDLEEPEVGDRVRFIDGNTTGELIEIQGDKAIVQTNGMKLKTEYDQLVKVDIETAGDKFSRPSFKTQTDDPDSAVIKKPGTSLEIRGMRGEEALKELEQYLDRALASGLDNVEIIHGKGQGILRQLVHEYLKKRKDVKHFDTAPLNRGGSGCTLVELE